MPQGNASMFKQYSQKGCVMDCIMRKLPCLPWDYPMPMHNASAESQPPLCTTYNDGGEHRNSLRKFGRKMNDFHESIRCEKECLPNCQETVYDFNVGVTKVNIEEVCEEGSETREVTDSHKRNNQVQGCATTL